MTRIEFFGVVLSPVLAPVALRAASERVVIHRYEIIDRNDGSIWISVRGSKLGLYRDYMWRLRPLTDDCPWVPEGFVITNKTRYFLSYEDEWSGKYKTMSSTRLPEVEASAKEKGRFLIR